jgi:subfamily B ATP-binding cassette protein HlyB/CyaB
MEFQQANIAVKRLGDILDMPQEPHTLTPVREAGGSGLIELQDLAFRYSDHHPWLYRNLDLTFKPGRFTVLMGPSGCGKSTLARLLLGFYLPQETVLFAGTLYDNLVMAQPHATFDEVIAACKAAEIHEVIDALLDGYQTEIGERGVGLSGGQKQRIAIARALLRQPRILIFDEATANLDPQTAEHFARTINKLKGKVTMLFIAHQLPKGLQVDEVVTLGEHGAKVAVVREAE